MHSTHIILVNLEEELEENSDKDLRKIAISIAKEETDCFYDRVFDGRHLLEEGEDDDFPETVVLSKDNWELFEDYLLTCDEAQKRYAKYLIDSIIKRDNTSNISTLISDYFLSHDRKTSLEDIEKNNWEWDCYGDTLWQLNTAVELMHGGYNIDSCFYDSYRGTALVPFIELLKQKPDNWALVAFNYHS